MHLKYKIIHQLKISYILFTLFFINLTISCKDVNRDCNKLSGIWAIDTMLIENKSFSKYLNFNTIQFKCKDKSAWFHGSRYFDKDTSAKWELFLNKDKTTYIIIKSSIKIYNSKFDVKFHEKANGRIKISMKSKNVYISAIKIMDGE